MRPNVKNYVVKLMLVLLFMGVKLSLQKTDEELEAIDAKVDEITEHCMREFSLEELPDYFSNEDGVVEKDIQCFIKCQQQRQGLMKGDGSMDFDALDKILAQFKECNSLVGENDCDTGYKVYDCNLDVLDELNIVLRI